MYVRWAESRGFEVDQQDMSLGTEAGIKSVVYQIKGPNAYGWLKVGIGLHRLVRISPSAGHAGDVIRQRLGLPGGPERQYRDRGDPSEIRIDTYRSFG